MEPRLAIIADDLTGAMDTGLQFGKAGHRTVVSLAGRQQPAADHADVVVVTTDSREVSPASAYEAVHKAVREMADGGVGRFYKKVDSTLRGHIGTELDAMLDALGQTRALFCPAFPESGRVLVGGYHLVRQVPLERTELASDPGAHFKTSYVPRFLQETVRRKVGHIPLQVVLDGPHRIRRAMEAAFASEHEVLVVDAATREDLAAVSEAAEQYGEPLLLAGSAGLAEQVAVRLGGRQDPFCFLESPGKAWPRRPVLFVSGSITEVNREQVAHLTATTDVVGITADAAALLSGNGQEQARVVAAAITSLKSGRDTLIQSAPDAASVKEGLEAGNRLRLSPQETRLATTTALAAIVGEVLGQTSVAGLMVTGGEVSRQVLHALGATQIAVVGEVQPGVPLGQVLRLGFPPLPIVTKSGSLGQTDAFCRAGTLLKQLHSEVLTGD